MKIAFFTEAGFTGKTPRTNPNMRTEYAWYVALDSDHYNIHTGQIDGEYDLGICIIPKKNPQFDIGRIRKNCKKVASMQEGPHWYFQDYPLDKQIWFYNVLMDMDFLFVHNEIDKKLVAEIKFYKKDFIKNIEFFKVDINDIFNKQLKLNLNKKIFVQNEIDVLSKHRSIIIKINYDKNSQVKSLEKIKVSFTNFIDLENYKILDNYNNCYLVEK